MGITQITAKRSTCLKHSMGAVLVKDKRILTTGYNGAPRGVEHCSDTSCMRDDQGIYDGENLELCKGLHAIQNAIIQGAILGVPIRGSVLFTTHPPCITCAKMLINTEVEKIITAREYPLLMPSGDELAHEMLLEANISMQKWEEQP
jgi:dCMP deaminase